MNLLNLKGMAIFGLCTVSSLPMAYAETFLPWLEDPWKMEEKVAVYGHRLKPVSCPNMVVTDKKMNLNEVVTAALCHNPETRSSYLGLLGSAASYGGNFSGYLPTITATVAGSRATSFSGDSKSTTHSKTSSVSAGMTLYDFGQRELSIDAAEQSLIATGYTYESSLQGLIATALSNYYSLLTAQNAVEVAKESEKFAQESLDAAELRYKIGLVALADKLQAKGSYSQAQLAVQQAKNTLSQSQATLALLLGLSPDTPIEVAEIDDSALTKDPFSSEVKTLMEKAKHSRVDLAASRASLESAKIAHRALKRSNLATISAGVDMGFDDADVFNTATERSQSIGLSVSIPIFTGFSNTYAESSSKKSLEAQQIDLEKTERDVENDVWSAWNNYDTAQQSWEVSWDQLASSTELKDVALGRYKEGIGTILDVLSAQSQYSSALQSHLQNRLDLLTARIDLIRAVGMLNLETMNAEKSIDTKVDNPPPTELPWKTAP